MTQHQLLGSLGQTATAHIAGEALAHGPDKVALQGAQGHGRGGGDIFHGQGLEEIGFQILSGIEQTIPVHLMTS